MKTTKNSVTEFMKISNKYHEQIADLFVSIDLIDSVLADAIIDDRNIIKELQSVRSELEHESNSLTSRICAMTKIENAINLHNEKLTTIKSEKTKKTTKTKEDHTNGQIEKGVDILKNILNIK